MEQITALSKLVRKSGVSLRFISSKTGIKYDRVSALYRGERILTLIDAKKISDVLNTDIKELLD